ncbi:MAG: hypothetical protein H0U13_04735 [Gemmatimonadaceae bacterium]|nr:hypothetical protein [Gemmatimonadaceae bacterium]
MIRSLLSFAAAVWFAYNAAAFLPVSGAYLNEGASGGIDGDPGAVAVTWAARTLFAGLAVIGLALIDWDWLGRELRSLGNLPGREGE